MFAWISLVTVDFIRLHGSTDFNKKPLICSAYTQTVDHWAKYQGLGYTMTYYLDELHVSGFEFEIFGLTVYHR